MTRPDPARRPVLLWDGDCAFCARCAAWARRVGLADDVDLLPWQDVDLAALAPDSLRLTAAACHEQVQWIGADRAGLLRRRSGAAAVSALLRRAGGAWAVPGVVTAVPPGSWLAAALYRLVAANRHRLPGGDPACALPAASAA